MRTDSLYSTHAPHTWHLQCVAVCYSPFFPFPRTLYMYHTWHTCLSHELYELLYVRILFTRYMHHTYGPCSVLQGVAVRSFPCHRLYTWRTHVWVTNAMDYYAYEFSSLYTWHLQCAAVCYSPLIPLSQILYTTHTWHAYLSHKLDGIL